MSYTAALAHLQAEDLPVDYSRFIAALVPVTDDEARARLIENKKSQMKAQAKGISAP